MLDSRIRCLYGRPSDEVGHLATISMSTNTEDAQFTADLLCDWTNEHETIPALAATSGAAAWDLTFSSPPAAQRVDWMVLWHNFDEGASIRIRGSNNNFASSPLDVTVVAPAKKKNGFSVKIPVLLSEETGYATSGFEKYRISVSSATSPAGLKVLAYETLRIFEAGNVFTEPRQPQRERGISLPTDFDFVWRYRLYASMRNLTAQILATIDDLVGLRDLFDDAGGQFLPWGFVLESDTADAMIVRFRADQQDGFLTSTLDPALYYQHALAHMVSLNLVELTAGLPEWT